MSLVRHFRRAAVWLAPVLAAAAPLQAIPVRFLPWDESVASRRIGFQTGAEVAALADLHPDKRSSPIAWTPGETPPQLVALDRAAADGTAPAVSVKLSAGMESPLVLILPDPAHPAGLRTFVIEESARSFGWGALRFINATGKELLLRQDDTVRQVPAGWTPVDIAPGGGARNIGIQIVARSDVKSILYSAVWEHHPAMRKLVFLVPGTDPGSGALDLKTVPEDRRAAAAAAP